MPVLLILLLALDADNFKTREAAHSALVKIAPLAWSAFHDATGPNLESVYRLRLIAGQVWPKLPLAEKQAIADTFRPKTWVRWPWIAYRVVGPQYNEYLSAAAAAGIPGGAEHCWESYREATRLCVAVLAETMSVAALQAMLEGLASEERCWIESNYDSWRLAHGHRRTWR